MEALSIVASVATLLELGLRVSREMDGVVGNWKSALPTILALYNEVTDLNVVLDHIRSAQATVQAKDAKHDAHFLETLSTCLGQVDGLLREMLVLLNKLSAMGDLKKKFRWLRQNKAAAALQGRIREVRMRISELLVTYNVSSVTRIDLQLRAVHATIQKNHSAILTKLESGPKVQMTQMQQITYHNDTRPGYLSQDLVATLAKTLVQAGQEAAGNPERTEEKVREILGRLDGNHPPRQKVVDQQSEMKAISAAVRRGGATMSNSITTPLEEDVETEQGAGHSVRFVARRRRIRCMGGCPCQCHNSGPPILRFGNSLIGKLFVGYSGIPGTMTSCNHAPCVRQGETSVEFSYVFPAWFLNYIVSAIVLKTATGGPNLGLFVTKRIGFEPGNILYSAFNGDVDGIKLCIQSDPFCVHYSGMNGGRTALHHALLNGCWDAIKVLLANGADPEATDDWGESTSAVAATYSLMPSRSSQKKMLNDIFGAEAAVSNSNLPFISRVIVGHCVGDAAQILKKATPQTRMVATTPDEMGHYPLYWACMYDNIEAVKGLLRSGASVEHGSLRDQVPPLHRAMHQSGLDILDTLIDAGAELEATDAHGWTPFHWACRGNNVAGMKRLLGLGVHPDSPVRTDGACSGAAIAAMYDQLEALECLASHGADLDYANAAGETPLMTSIVRNAHRSLRYLLSKGACHLAYMKLEGMTILHAAGQVGNAKTMEILAEFNLAGLDPFARSTAGRTAQQVFEQRKSQCVELIGAWTRLLDAVDLANSGLWPEPETKKETNPNGTTKCEEEGEDDGVSMGDSDVDGGSTDVEDLGEEEYDDMEDWDGDVFHDAVEKLEHLKPEGEEVGIPVPGSIEAVSMVSVNVGA